MQCCYLNPLRSKLGFGREREISNLQATPPQVQERGVFPLIIVIEFSVKYLRNYCGHISIMSVKQRKFFILAEKVATIHETQAAKKKGLIAKEKGLPASTVSTIYKARDHVLRNFESLDPKMKKARKCDFPEIDHCLIQWFNQKRNQDVPISGPILLEKAKEFAEKIGGASTSFSGSIGWLKNLRNDMASKCILSAVNPLLLMTRS